MGPLTPPAADDRALVAAVLARTPGAFERLVRAYERLCWHIIDRMVRHPEDTRELCQETFLRVHRHLPQYRFESSLGTWIGRVAYSVARRHLERKRVPLLDVSADQGDRDVLEGIAGDFDLEAASADAQLVAALHAEIEALAPVQRMILTLYHLDEIPIAEIAAITGFAEGSIKSYLFRARAKLRARLEARIGGTT